MKQNLSQIQYEQLAREQFCNRLKEIPFVSDIEVFLEKKNADARSRKKRTRNGLIMV